MTAESSATDRDVERAVGVILRSTRARPQTQAELADKLRDRDVGDAVVRAAMERARELGAVDDAAFAAAWVADRGRQRGYGRPRLRQELVRRQVPDHLIEEALAGLADLDEEAVAKELAERRFGGMPASLEPEAAARRLSGYLARRGYPAGLCQRVAISVVGLDRSWD